MQLFRSSRFAVFKASISIHVKTSWLSYIANYLTGFYMMGNFGFKWLSKAASLITFHALLVMVSSYTPWKHEKTFGFMMFSGCCRKINGMKWFDVNVEAGHSQLFLETGRVSPYLRFLIHLNLYLFFAKKQITRTALKKTCSYNIFEKKQNKNKNKTNKCLWVGEFY